MCTFLFGVLHCGILDSWIVGFVNEVNYSAFNGLSIWLFLYSVVVKMTKCRYSTTTYIYIYDKRGDTCIHGMIHHQCWPHYTARTKPCIWASVRHGMPILVINISLHHKFIIKRIFFVKYYTFYREFQYSMIIIFSKHWCEGDGLVTALHQTIVFSVCSVSEVIRSTILCGTKRSGFRFTKALCSYDWYPVKKTLVFINDFNCLIR